MNYTHFYAHWIRYWYIRSPVPFPLRKLMVMALPRPRHSSVKVAGYQLDLDMRDLLQANLLLDHHWEPYFASWWMWLVQSSQTIFDIGAHCGYFTLIARRYAPSEACIHAFEPNPNMQRQLSHTIQTNLLPNIHMVPYAVSNDNGKISLYVRSTLEPGASSRMNIPYADTELNVDTVSLDQYCSEKQISNVDLIKMDIEGGEVLALEGMRQGITEARYKVLMMELHPHSVPPSSLESMLNMLRAARYTIYEIADYRVTPLPEGLPQQCNHIIAVSEQSLQSLAPSLQLEDIEVPKIV